MIARTRRHLLASTLLAGAAAFAAPAHAQSAETNTQEEVADVGDSAARLCQDNPNSPECAAEGQAIVVTGSRIASPTLTSASPLQIVDAQDIDEAGVVNVQEVLLENPAFGTPGISRTNSNFASNSGGVATVDLRDLNSNRTLVLVNGRRFVAGIPASATVDLNTIPTQFIERIDILTGGASSIYGSDAVAGVVNIIYRDDFEGVELSGQLGVSQRGDDVRKQANLLLGTNFADGRGNLSAFMGYSREGSVFSRNRKRSQLDQISLALLTGDVEDLFTPSAPFLSGFNPSGTFFLRPDNPATTANEAINRTFSTCGGGIIVPQTNAATCPTGFNRSAFRTIAIPTERYLMALRGNYDITDSIGVFIEGTFAKTATRTEIEPFPLQSNGPGGVFQATGGRFDIEQDVTLADGSVVRVRNPLVPAAFFDLATDVVGTAGDPANPLVPNGLRDLGFQQRMSSFGTRGARADRTTFRVLAGLDGTVFKDWRWDAFYAYGETVESQTSSGQVNTANLRAALNVIPDVNDVDADGNRSEPICADAQARVQGCVPANVFGPGLLSAEAVNFIQAPASRNTLTSQKLAGANLSGSLFEGWAGPIGLAVGVEYRKEFSRAENDVLTQVGGNGGNALPSVQGSFDVVEGYAELAVPLLREVPFFHMLEARGAVRVSDYSTVGTTYSWNYGLEWAPVPDIRFRAVKARATRAPNIGELFTPPSQSFPVGLVDPCEGVTAATGGTLGAQCRADPGVAANIAAFGEVTLTQADLQGVASFGAGNPQLEEETADTLTLGAVINPTSIDWLRNFVLTVDYFDIKVDDLISAVPLQSILNQCYIEGNQDFCDDIDRCAGFEGPNNPGSLETIFFEGVNLGGLKTDGIDFTLSYRQNLENWGLGGRLNARLSWTHIFDYEIEEFGGVINPVAGEVGTSKNKVFGSVAYELGDWGMTLRGTYIGPAVLDNQFVEQFGVDPDDSEIRKLTRIGSEFVADLQLRFTPGDNYEFYLGVDNLLDNEPPPIITGLPANSTGTETAASTYDPIGRRFYAGARLKF